MKEKSPDTIDESRRRAIAKFGAYAAFTAPAVSTLLISNKVTAQSINAGPARIVIDPDNPGESDWCVGGNDACDP